MAEEAEEWVEILKKYLRHPELIDKLPKTIIPDEIIIQANLTEGDKEKLSTELKALGINVSFID